METLIEQIVITPAGHLMYINSLDERVLIQGITILNWFDLAVTYHFLSDLVLTTSNN